MDGATFHPTDLPFQLLIPTSQPGGQASVDPMVPAREYVQQLSQAIRRRLETLKAPIKQIVAVGVTWPGPVRDNCIAGTSGILRRFPPMGVYETLFRFADATHKYMGEPGTHPWAQGFPLTVQGGALVTRVLFKDAGGREKPKAIGVEYIDQAHVYGADPNAQPLASAPRKTL